MRVKELRRQLARFIGQPVEELWMRSGNRMIMLAPIGGEVPVVADDPPQYGKGLPGLKVEAQREKDKEVNREIDEGFANRSGTFSRHAH